MGILRRVDKKKFKELTYPHMEFLYNMGMKYTARSYDAEDLVQETMYTAYRKFHQLRDTSKCRAWLFSILRSHFLREYRKYIKRPLLDDGSGYLKNIPDTASVDFVDHVDSKMDKARVEKGLAGLDEKFRTIVVLYYMEEMTYQEIADFLDIPIGTVMSRLARGKKHLKSSLVKSAFGTAKKGADIVYLTGLFV